MKALVIEDEEIMRITIQNALRDAGQETQSCECAEQALSVLEKDVYDAAVVDLKMPGMNGLEFLEIARRDYPEMAIVMITAHGTVETAVGAMKMGAYDYLTKPFDTDELIIILERHMENRQVREENRQLKNALKQRYGFHQLVGKSPGMQKVYETLDVICTSDCSVLISGETGTGKGMVARAIHYNSGRRDGPMISVSCATLSQEILESELFGHVRGAFTGAIADKKGRFAMARGGTLFLDEVDDIPLELQVKLLRVLEEGVFERVGSGETLATDVRIVAASKIDLQQRIEEGLFRADLYYRLNQVPLPLPPLRERRDDIPPLIDYFLKDRNPPPQLSPAALDVLLDYSWPGNVRELKNAVERLALFHPLNIAVEDLPHEILARPTWQNKGWMDGRTFEEMVADTEKYLLLQALERSDGNQREAARLLDMPASSFHSRLERHGLV